MMLKLKKKPPTPVTVSFSLNEETIKQIDAVAAFYETNRSVIVRELIAEHYNHLLESDPKGLKAAENKIGE